MFGAPINMVFCSLRQSPSSPRQRARFLHAGSSFRVRGRDQRVGVGFGGTPNPYPRFPRTRRQRCREAHRPAAFPSPPKRSLRKVPQGSHPETPGRRPPQAPWDPREARYLGRSQRRAPRAPKPRKTPLPRRFRLGSLGMISVEGF